MAYLKEKLDQLKAALAQWESIQNEPYSDIVRDASIQRYEFSFELLWKALKLYLKAKDGIECNSPKSCFREARMSLGLSEEEIELCLKMTDDRNLSVHTYSEEMARKLYESSKSYFELSKKIFSIISEI